jgi:glycosyltransferase involved in cell wall biosynthesis
MRKLPDRPVQLVHVTTVPITLDFLIGQVGYMKRRGFDVHAVSSSGEALDRFGAAEQVPVHAVEMARRITPLRDLVALVQMIRLFQRIRPDIVHAHTPKGGLLGTIAGWCAGVPVRIYHIRGLPLTAAVGPRRILLWWTEKTACLLATRVLCVSHSIRQVAVHESICPQAKLAVLQNGSGNGVDAEGKFNSIRWQHTRQATRERLNIPTGSIVVGFVGRLVRQKGIGELFDAWRILRVEFPTLHLLLVGSFEEEDRVPAVVREGLQLDSRVRLTGAQRETPPLYAAMDIVVLPTYREGLPNVPLEAAAMELPVVATQVPGCVDAVQNGVTGTLVPPRDAVALAQAIRRYVLQPELRVDHGYRGRLRVSTTFRQDVVWKALHSEYERLLVESSLTSRGRLTTRATNAGVVKSKPNADGDTGRAHRHTQPSSEFI